MALVIAGLVLPSALNVPQANPTEVAEFAPVPPEDDTPPPPQDSGLSDLGMGVTDSLLVAEEPEVIEIPDEGAGGENPVTHRCVGDPPRQTEDPMAPPCVPFWEGDNLGETWQGVTGDKITVLVYAATWNTLAGSEGYESSPGAGRYCDVDGTAPDEDFDNCGDQGKGFGDHSFVRVVRALSTFFNTRFMTYDRDAHFWIYWSSASSPGARRADAHDNWETLQPFAVVDYAFFGGFNDVYADAMTRRRSMVFGNFGMLEASFFQEMGPFTWSFWPDIERWVEPYLSYVCQKVAPYPVMHSGIDNHMGQERRYALLRPDDETHPGLRRAGRLLQARLKEYAENGCPETGATIDIVEDLTFPRHQYSLDTHPDAHTAARQNIAQMISSDVTTVLWLGGYEVLHSEAAADNDYYPEWVVAGDLLNDNITQARFQDQDVWRHAWYVTPHLRADRSEEAPCRMAFREARPRGTGSEENTFCDLYRPIFMMFRGIQASGPELTPHAVERGNRAIPRQSSTSPYVAACFFEEGDYTCVKDAHEAWWDPDAPDPDGDPSETGCFRMVREGQRFLPWTWEGGGDDVFNTQNPPTCNNERTGSAFINPYGPAG